MDAAVFLLVSICDFAGSGGDVTSFDAALLSHAKGFVGFLDAPGGNCGDRSRTGTAEDLGGAAHGTDGKAAENPWKRDGLGRGFVGRPAEGSFSEVVIVEGIDRAAASSSVAGVVESRDIRCAVSRGDAEGRAVDSSSGSFSSSEAAAEGFSSILDLGGSDGGLDVCLSATGGGCGCSPSAGEIGASPVVSLASSNFCVEYC